MSKLSRRALLSISLKGLALMPFVGLFLNRLTPENPNAKGLKKVTQPTAKAPSRQGPQRQPDLYYEIIGREVFELPTDPKDGYTIHVSHQFNPFSDYAHITSKNHRICDFSMHEPLTLDSICSFDLVFSETEQSWAIIS